MGKKGSWLSAIKRVFTHSSKDKPTVGSEKKGGKEKKKDKGIRRPEKSKSLLPLFREPSSIEKILGEADQLLIRPNITNIVTTTNNDDSTNINVTNNAITSSSSSPPILPAKPLSPRVTSPKATFSPPLKALTSGVSSSSSEAFIPKVTTDNRKEITNVPTLTDQNLSATKIQAVFRGYMARRSFRAVNGLARLQEVLKGQNVKRQTANAMKQLQLFVRVHTQIQSQRIRMLENQRQDYRIHNKDLESTLSKWTNQLSENEDWDDSLLTKEEVEARRRKKAEAVIKRERAMAYAYSHQLWKDSPSSAHSPLDPRTNGFPWWWNWLDRQLTDSKNVLQTTTPPPSGPTSERGPSHRAHNNNRESTTPQSSRSVAVGPAWARCHPTGTRFPMKDNDDDSLVSCPLFSVPSYMSPTVSAMAKARRFTGTRADSGTGRRFSFPLTPNSGRWGKVGPVGDSSSRSVAEFSVGSATSMPAMVGRKPFNRFV
ncbi:IQ-domain 13 [Striga hermonthica]|uniref:IQ-domain 13 n=1 Tax=Striga hermonthica TaxID=68872 RepID=A0A9N7N245_STRHE|nr:IQ-domain 13 [Striga hermonthica]